MYAQCVKKFIDSYKQNSFDVDFLRFKVVQHVFTERHYLLCFDSRNADANMVNSVYVHNSLLCDFDGFYRKFPEGEHAARLAERVLTGISNKYGVRFRLHTFAPNFCFDLALVESGVTQVALCYDMSKLHVDLVA